MPGFRASINSRAGGMPRADTGWGRGKGADMPDASTAAAQAVATPQGGDQNPSAEGSGKTFTQEEVNAMLAKEKREGKAFDYQSECHCSKTYYDKDNKRSRQIDLDHRHRKM